MIYGLGRMQVWNLLTRQRIAPTIAGQLVFATAFAQDSGQVLTASGWEDGRSMIQAFDLLTGKETAQHLAHYRGLPAEFSPDGKRIVALVDKNIVRVWDTATGDPVGKPMTHPNGTLQTVAFSSDNARIVTGTSVGDARVWDTSTGEPVTGTLEHRQPMKPLSFFPSGGGGQYDLDPTSRQPLRPVNSAEFSADCRWVVTASRDGTARVWDAASGRARTPPLEHGGAVNAAAFNADGTLVVTASDDGTVRIWDSATGKLLSPPLEHGTNVVTASFSPDGKRLITAADHVVRIWDVPMDDRKVADWVLTARTTPFEVTMPVDDEPAARAVAPTR